MTSLHQKLVDLGFHVVRFYKKDLFEHDKLACEQLREGDLAFWSPRECGTEFINCPSDDIDSVEWNLGYLRAAEKTWGPGRTWYKIEHGRVTLCTFERAVDYMRERIASLRDSGHKRQEVSGATIWR